MRSIAKQRAIALFALLAAPGTLAQLTSVPNLTTASELTATSNPSESATTTGSSATTGTSGGTTSTTTGATSTTNTGSTSTTSGAAITHLSGLPDIGVGIPTLVIPYTADAPFMQKSSLPEGTVFIAVGAVLAFLGACVLLWRGAVAWSINRSVKRAALAALGGRSDKISSHSWRPGAGTGAGRVASKTGFYKDYDKAGSSMSLDALTSSGKPIKSSRDYHSHENFARGGAGAIPPAGLFFSPTANAQQRSGSALGTHSDANRSSSYLPAGYYAAPAAAQAAGGAGTTTLGGPAGQQHAGHPLAPYARPPSTATPSPPLSPNLNPTVHPAAQYQHISSSPGGRDGRMRAASRDRLGSRDGGLRAGSRDLSGRYRTTSRDRYSAQTSSFYGRPSSSSLAVGLGGGRLSHEQLGAGGGGGGSQAPSAYMEDLFDHHGNGPRERF